MGEERVAKEYGRVGTVGVVGGIGAVARVGAVEDVVVDQCSEVNQLDNRRPANQVDGWPDAGARTKGEEGTEALARVGEDFANHRTDLGFEASLLFREERLEGREVRF